MKNRVENRVAQAMEDQFRESDWKHFRKLRPLFRERFYERGIIKFGTVICETEKSYEERHWDLVELMEDMDYQFKRAFVYDTRSCMRLALAEIRRQNLITPEEFAGFSPELQSRVLLIQKTLSA